MTSFSSKTIVLFALMLSGCLWSGAANANVLRTNDGVAVRTTDGQCVLTGTDGVAAAADCSNAATGEAVPLAYDKAVYFDFNKSTLSHRAKHRLNRLAHYLKAQRKLHHGHQPKITIVGYADRIGESGYNERLALKRAKSVRAFLVRRGVKARKIEVRSLGKTAPKADCAADLPRARLIKCLREDRRVEIEFNDQ